MKVFVLFLVFYLTTACARAEVYNISNGYLSFHGSGGAIQDLRADPSGAGNYGPILAKQIYLGDQPPTADLPFETTNDTVTISNVRVYSNPRIVGLNEWDTAVRLEKGETLGQLFSTDKNGLVSVSIRVPTWHSNVSSMTLKLYKDRPGGLLIAEKRCENVEDNSWQTITFPLQDKGTFYLEMSDPRGPVGWWTALKGPQVGRMYRNGEPMDFGSRAFRATIYDVFPAQVKISVVGAKLFAEAVADDPKRAMNWNVVTPFERDGYEISDPSKIPFNRFYSDTGQYIPIAQFKRRDSLFGMKADKWVHASGNSGTDLRFGADKTTVEWVIEPDSLTLKLGPRLAITAEPATGVVPDYYPVFYTSDPAFDAAINTFFYERAYSWPLGGVSADWFEWMALIHFWNYRPGSLEHWRERLLTYKIDEEGYVYTWGDAKGWPFPDNNVYDTRHFTTNSNLILACYRFYAWTRDRQFLKDNASRIRAAMEFMLSELQGAEGILVLPDKDHGGTPDDVHSNYWDDLPFGGRSAYENAYFYASLGAMAAIESALGNTKKAAFYNDLRSKCRAAYNKLFWRDDAGRYIGCIDKNGVVRDYGFTYVNMEAAYYGLAEKQQVERIYNWMEHEKTSSGKTDTYARFRFAPRANTIDCKQWWYLNGTAEIPSQAFDTHLENGGAILYTSGYDVMTRARYLGADNAFRRLKEILDRWNEPDRLCGGAPLRYGEVNGWQVGTDVPFPESGLVPASFLYGFLGIQATGDGLSITPNLPSELSFAGVRNLRYRGLMLDVKVTRTSVSIKCSDPNHPIDIIKTIRPGGTYLFTLP